MDEQNTPDGAAFAEQSVTKARVAFRAGTRGEPTECALPKFARTVREPLGEKIEKRFAIAVFDLPA
jgi:hypothetical protein